MIIKRKTISKEQVEQLREEWLENCEKEKEKIKKLSDELEKANGIDTEDVIKAKKDFSDISKETKDSMNSYHEIFDTYINNKLKSLERSMQNSAKGEIEKIKNESNDWNGIFDVLERYGVKL